VARTFDSYSQVTLVLGAGAGLAARTDLSVIADEAAQHIELFVINYRIFFGAKLAFARPGKEAARGITSSGEADWLLTF